MSESDGIIYSMQQRRQLQAELDALGATTSQAALQDAVHRLAERFPAEMLQAAVLRHLATSSSQLRGGLGELCTLLPPSEIVPALRNVAANRGKSPQERTTAALILERYLQQTGAHGLLADLAGADEVPYQSLLEAIEESRSNRHVLLEYVTQMQEHPVDVAFMVLRLIDRLPVADRADLLRLIAQDTRPQVAHAAVERLSAAAAGEKTADGAQSCLRSLHALSLALPPADATLVERSLRKLQFGGKRYQPPVAHGWQALLGPSDASSYQSVWLVRYPHSAPQAADSEQSSAANHAPAGEDGAWLGFVLSVQSGILQFSGSEDMLRTFLPRPAEPGEMVPVRTGMRDDAILLCIPFELGRWLVQQGLKAHWENPSAEPLPPEYLLYNDLVWQFGAPKLPPDLATWWDRSGAQPNILPSALPDAMTLAEAAGGLVEDEAMQGWVRWSKALWNNVKYRSQQPPDVPSTTLISLLLREMSRMPDHRLLLKSMVAGLRTQTLWYAVAGNTVQAERAALLAQATAILPITDNPLVGGLLAKGLGA